jgi:cytosine/adenosine deaminase-related metal-dependent hydrolase
VDPQIGTLETADVHLRAGTIQAVGPNLSAPAATVIDATDRIVMPGFVETHWHMWTSVWRGIAEDASDYFRLQSWSENYTAQDHYDAVRYAALEAVNAGITTVHNWAHGVSGYADVEAELRALADAGVRARMGYVGVAGGQPTRAADLQRAQAWIQANGGGRLSLSMLLDGAGEYFPTQVMLARELGIRTITDHGAFLAHPELLGPEFLYTHGTGLTPAQIQLIAQRGIKVGLCPGTDPMIGAGLPPIHALLTGGVPLDNISVTVDVAAQTPADPFEMLRTLVNAARIQQMGSTDLLTIARANPEWLFSYRDAIRVGTLSGANVLGMAEQVGSLTPGKRADVIVVRLTDVNMLAAPGIDPVMQLIQHGQPGNVETVFVDGQLRKQAGGLVGVGVPEVMAAAGALQARLRAQAQPS